MDYPEEQVAELKQLADEIKYAEEGGYKYFFIPALKMPVGCTPEKVDALLCPMPRDGYPSRLYYAEKISSPVSRNWNISGIRILERNWYAFSWQYKDCDLRLLQMIGVHLRGLS